MFSTKSSTFEVEEQKKKSKEKEENDVLLVTEKDLKQRDINIDAKVSPFLTLAMVCNIAYEKLKKKKRKEKPKEHAILDDRKIDGLVR
ncbi:hypothetical protein Peur_031617 [Populus x canadensis]